MKIAVVHNCQGPGIAEALEAALPGASLRHVDIATALAGRAFSPDDYDLCYLNNRLRERLGLPQSDRLRPLPNIVFDGFHPDFCYIESDEGRLGTLAQPYQSLLCLAGYLSGRDVEQTQALFTPEIMAGAGYLDRYGAARTELLALCASHGLDLADRLPVWVRRGAFMHTLNHPRIDVLQDVALACLLRDGVITASAADQARRQSAGLCDRLMQSVILPVYPAIALRYGSSGGGFLFRLANCHHFGLESYVEASLAEFRRAGVRARDVVAVEARLEHVLDAVRAP